MSRDAIEVRRVFSYATGLNDLDREFLATKRRSDQFWSDIKNFMPNDTIDELSQAISGTNKGPRDYPSFPKGKMEA
jgi:hypothetical protein